jgi:predicted phosphodiesterase
VRVALLADVHANLPALESVLRDVRGRGVEGLLHAGDIVGYHPYPDEVIARFRTEGVISILGNHDRSVLSGDTSWFNSVAAEAIDWTRERISEEGRAYLRGLVAR